MQIRERYFANITASCTRMRLYWRTLPGNVRGGVYILIAAFCFSLMIALIKIAGRSLQVTEILFFRQFTMLLIAAPVIFANFPRSLHSAKPGLQMLRIAIAFIAILLGFSAYIHLPLAEVTAITFAKAFFITILAVFLLRESVGVRRWAAVFVGFLGVLVIAWPTGGHAFNIYGLMAIAGAACAAAAITIVRILSLEDQPVTIMTYQSIGVGLLMAVPTIYFWKTPTLNEFFLLIAIGVVSAAAQYYNILGLRTAEVSAVGPLDYARLIYSLVLGVWLFGEWPEIHTFGGAALIVAAAIYTLYRERLQAEEGTANKI